MLRVLRAVAALGGAAALVVPTWTAPAGAADETVNVGEGNENTFTPATVRIRPGDTVTWQYAGGSGHNVTSTTRNWEKADPVGPPAVLNLQTSYLFDKAGTYRYVCTTHSSVGMKGTVIVEGTAKPSPSRTPTRTPSPTRSSVPPPPPSSSPGSTPSETPSPSAGTASPGIPSVSPGSASPTSGPPLPSVAPPPTGPRDLGSGGLTPQPATPRGKGLPVMLALLLIGGVGSAELRALLASTPRYPQV